MSWGTPKELTCETQGCGKTILRKNPKKCSSGQILCTTCKNKAARKRFEDLHGVSLYERYSKGNPIHTKWSRQWKLNKLYGMSMSDYDILLEKQGGVCAICKTCPEEVLVVDHDHTTGNVRGLLCNPCNRAIGQLKDSVPTLQSAINYLQHTKSNQNWDGYFLQIASLVATRSKDPSTHVGSVLVRDRTIISTGYNGFPRGVNDDLAERYVRPLKYQWTVHAEENCILAAARSGSKTDNTTLYVTPLFPCARCATSIVQAGVKEVVSSDHLRDNPRWADEFVQSQLIFAEAGVVFRNPDTTNLDKL